MHSAAVTAVGCFVGWLVGRHVELGLDGAAPRGHILPAPLLAVRACSDREALGVSGCPGACRVATRDVASVPRWLACLLACPKIAAAVLASRCRRWHSFGFVARWVWEFAATDDAECGVCRFAAINTGHWLSRSDWPDLLDVRVFPAAAPIGATRCCQAVQLLAEAAAAEDPTQALPAVQPADYTRVRVSSNLKNQKNKSCASVTCRTALLTSYGVRN